MSPFPLPALSVQGLRLLAATLLPLQAIGQPAPQDNWTLDRIVTFSGMSTGTLRDPRMARRLSDGTIAVSDTRNHRIQIFSETGNFIRSFGRFGTGDGEFNEPWSATELANGDLVVTDLGNHRIQVFTKAGAFVRKWGGVSEPIAAEELADGRIAVAEWGASRVQIFESNGISVRSWPVNRPYGLTRLNSGQIATVLHMDHVVRIYSDTGALIREFGGFGSGNGQLHHPSAVAGLGDGKIAVMDDINGRLQIFYPDGTFFKVIGAPGAGDGQFNRPGGVSSMPDGRLLVADSGNHRVQFFSAEGTFLSKWGLYGEALTDLGDVQFIDADPQHNLIVVQAGNRLPHVQTFSREGALLSRFSFKSGIGTVYRSESGKYYVGYAAHFEVYRADGSFEIQVGTPGNASSAPGAFGGQGVIVVADRSGTIYAADPGLSRVQKFSSGGVFLKAFGEPGTGPGQMTGLKGLGIMSDGNVTVRAEGRLQKFTPEGVVLDNFWWGAYQHWRSSDGGPIIYGPDDFFLTNTPAGTYDVRRFYSRDRNHISESIGFSRHSGDYFKLDGGARIQVWRRGFRSLGTIPPKLVPMPSVPRVAQRENGFIDVDYSVTDGDSATVDTALVAYRGGSALIRDLVVIRATDLVEGSASRVGTGIATGVVHRLTWNPTGYGLASGDLIFEALARDDRPKLLDMDFITLPTSPARTISRGPILHSDMRTVWAWLLANGEPGLSRTADGEVAGPGGTFTFTSGTETRTNFPGRAWLFARLGVREATIEEVQVARLATSTNGVPNRFTPSASQMMGGRPGALNEWGFDSADYGTEAWWVVPSP